MTEEIQIQKQFKVKIGFEETAKGLIYFSGYVHFDELNSEEIKKNSKFLAEMLEMTEKEFRKKGYKLSKDVK